ncbi:MAG: hypothetical protein LUG18_07375 [Candidatus Azobacteroides sp.]|nr:hypothetical protein [Candidatus Azobacteroides sp.]
MNYIELINHFWAVHEEQTFRTVEVALYFYLLKVNNACLWKKYFRRNNRKVEADLGISFNTLKEARNNLKEAGLIDFRSISGNGNVTYTLRQTSSDSDEVSFEDIDEVPVDLFTRLATGKDKPNQTKQKKEKEEKEVLLRFSPPSMEEVKLYFREKGLSEALATGRAERFYHFYDSKNWMVGKNKMANWKSAATRSLTWQDVSQKSVYVHPATSYKFKNIENDTRW